MPDKLLQRLPYFFLAAVAGIVGLHPIHESDPYWHLMLGRAVLRHGTRIVPEPTALVDFAPSCIVPEWLWGVSTYLVHGWMGAAGLSVLAALLAVLSALLIAGLCRSVAEEQVRRAFWWVTVLVVCAAFHRLRLRPQAAFLCLLPGFLWLTHRYLHRGVHERRWLSLGIAGTALLWAQLHGSFVLVPALFLIQTLPGARARLRPYLRESGPLLVVVFGSLLTGAHGVDLIAYIHGHAAGDASHFVGDLLAPTWDSMGATRSPSGAAIWLLWLLSAVGMILQRRMPLRALALAILGALLLNTAQRFVSAAAVLTAPLAVQGAVALYRHLGAERRAARVLSLCALLPCLGVSVWTVQWVNGHLGPVGKLGFADGVFPDRATRFLKGMPEGTAVLTDYPAGAPLGFHLDGHVRTYVDGRTPLYFDDTDLAVQREAMQFAPSLRLQVEHFDFRAAVVRRDSIACVSLRDTGWTLATVDPIYSTFVPEVTPETLRGFEPCGPFYLKRKCPDPSGVDAGIARVARWSEDGFPDHLRAERNLECGGDSRQALSWLRAVEGEALAYERGHQRRMAEALIEVGEVDAALKILSTMAARGDLELLQPLTSPQLADVAPERLRALLERLEEALRDNLPPPVRSELARLCALTSDVECARFHGFRAASRGQVQVAPVLQWVAREHPLEHVRRAALRWSQTLLSPGAPDD